jgi:hypothetical protein
MTLQPIPSEFPNILGKLDFFFFSVLFNFFISLRAVCGLAFSNLFFAVFYTLVALAIGWSRK